MITALITATFLSCAPVGPDQCEGGPDIQSSIVNSGSTAPAPGVPGPDVEPSFPPIPNLPPDLSQPY